MGDLRERVRMADLSGYVREELAFCKRCGGYGEVEFEELEDYHHREYRRWREPCTTCNSTGRVYKQTLNLYGFRPFKEAGDGN